MSTYVKIKSKETKEKGAEKLQGIYIPTAKNGMVKEFYHELGFTLIKQQEDGTTEWEYMLSLDC